MWTEVDIDTYTCVKQIVYVLEMCAFMCYCQGYEWVDWITVETYRKYICLLLIYTKESWEMGVYGLI